MVTFRILQVLIVLIFPQIQKLNHINQFISISWKGGFSFKFATVAAVADNHHDCESTAGTWRECPEEESPNCLSLLFP